MSLRTAAGVSVTGALALVVLVLPLSARLPAQNPAAGQSPNGGPTERGRGPRDPNAEKYATYCAGCHGSTLSGGRAPTLLDDTWHFGGDDASLMQSIREGRAGTEMQPFKSVFSDEEIKGLIDYLRAQAVLATNSATRAQSPAGQVVKAEQHAFKFEVVTDGISTPWALAFTPDGRLLVTERSGALRVIEKGKLLPKAIEGTPSVWTQQDGGLFDVELQPDYAKNGWIYLSYADPGPDGSSMTVIIRGRIKGGRWVDQEVLYKAPPELYWVGNIHYGSRFIFDKQGHLFYSIGDRGHETDAQDLSKPNGKIHRVNDDGSIPKDNPFVNRPGALPSIWSYGQRNPQGFAFHPVTGKLWESEHGPTGGDELNRIEPGYNYGWPIVHFGQPTPNRGGTPPGVATPPTPPPSTEGMDLPVKYWNPSIAPSGITFYTGDKFPEWKGDLFVTGLGGEALRRLETDGDKVVHEEIVFKGFGRVRDVVTGPDGFLYVALSIPGVRMSDTTPGMIVRMIPADNGKSNGTRKDQ
jgi:glucose/arabinose dehydrogenase